MNELHGPSDSLMYRVLGLLTLSLFVFRTWLSEGLPGGCPWRGSRPRVPALGER